MCVKVTSEIYSFSKNIYEDSLEVSTEVQELIKGVFSKTTKFLDKIYQSLFNINNFSVSPKKKTRGDVLLDFFEKIIKCVEKKLNEKPSYLKSGVVKRQIFQKPREVALPIIFPKQKEKQEEITEQRDGPKTEERINSPLVKDLEIKEGEFQEEIEPVEGEIEEEIKEQEIENEQKKNPPEEKIQEPLRRDRRKYTKLQSSSKGRIGLIALIIFIAFMIWGYWGYLDPFVNNDPVNNLPVNNTFNESSYGLGNEVFNSPSNEVDLSHLGYIPNLSEEGNLESEETSLQTDQNRSLDHSESVPQQIEDPIPKPTQEANEEENLNKDTENLSAEEREQVRKFLIEHNSITSKIINIFWDIFWDKLYYICGGGGGVWLYKKFIKDNASSKTNNYVFYTLSVVIIGIIGFVALNNMWRG